MKNIQQKQTPLADEVKKESVTKQKTKECIDGTYRVFTQIKVSFGKTELIQACIKQHQYKTKYTEPKTANEVIKWAKETFDLIGKYDVTYERLEEEFYNFEALAVASVNRLFPELESEEYHEVAK